MIELYYFFDFKINIFKRINYFEKLFYDLNVLIDCSIDLAINKNLV